LDLLIADPLSLVLEEARFGKTKKGKTALFDKEGYRYLKNQTRNTGGAVKVWWNCEYKSKLKSKSGCPGNCVTEGLFIKSKKGTHYHKPGEPVIKDTKRVFRINTEYKPKIRIKSFESLEIKKN
jgi:hypothetical protein